MSAGAIRVLTAAEMREVDRRTIELGIPGIVLMENAGQRVVDFLAEEFSPLNMQRIVVMCGKGNNGGDGLVIARQLFTRFKPKSLHVVLVGKPGELKGDAAQNLRMLVACGCSFVSAIDPEMRAATVVVDALLGTGAQGAARGETLAAIREVNSAFPDARVVAVDMPSGLGSDSPEVQGEYVRADYTVTFTAPKVSQVLAPTCDLMGELRVCAIGSPPDLYRDGQLALITPDAFRHLLAPRAEGGNKGTFGHVLVLAGSRGKTGAAAMAGLGALRSGAGLVTIASAESALATIAAHAPELMTEPLPESSAGAISDQAEQRIFEIAERKTVVAAGPGLGTEAGTVQLLRRVFEQTPLPLVMDADGLNALAKSGGDWSGHDRIRILTPHPGEMSRLTGKTVEEIQRDRVAVARELAKTRQVHLVLKGQRTLIAFPDGQVWVNPTGSPAMATGGTGDILTGMIAGFLAQFPGEPASAIAAAVYLHGLAGELGACELGDLALIATDLLKYLPAAMHEVSHSL